MSNISDLLASLGYYDSARNYRKHILTVKPAETETQSGKINLGVRLITAENVEPSPTSLELVPAATIMEHDTPYELTEDGFTTTLTRGDGREGEELGGVYVWYYQGDNSYADPPIFTLPHYPFQKELRGTSSEATYNPELAKYHDFRQDHSAVHSDILLNEFDLSSTVLGMSMYRNGPALRGNDLRQFRVLYMEFKDQNGDPVVNPMFADIEVPERFGHYFVFDNTRSQAHIIATLNAQVKQVNSGIKIKIRNGEGTPYRSLSLRLPVGWSYNCPYFIYDGFDVDDGGYQNSQAISADGKTALFQEELLHLNTLQGVDGIQEDQSILTRNYHSQPDGVFPWPSLLLYPSVADPVVIPWTTTDFDTTRTYTVDVTVPVSAYKYDAARPWQVFAELNVTPEVGKVSIKSASWIIENMNGEEIEEVPLPAYFIRYIDGHASNFESADNDQIARVFDNPDQGAIYTHNAKLSEATMKTFGTNMLAMRVAPPPIDGYGDSPFVRIKPTEAKLRITFHRSLEDSRFEFWSGSDLELQKTIELLNPPEGMFPPLGEAKFSFQGSDDGSELIFDTNRNFDWTSGFVKLGFYIGKTIVDEIVAESATEGIQFKAEGWGKNAFGQTYTLAEFLNFRRQDGSVLLPIWITSLDYLETDSEDISCWFEAWFEDEEGDYYGDIDYFIETQVRGSTFGYPEENSEIALPFVITNVLQGRLPSEVTVSLLLGGSIWDFGKSLIRSTTLDNVDPTTKEILFPGLENLRFKATFDEVDDTLTITEIGGPSGYIGLSTDVDDLPYATPNLPEGTYSTTEEYPEWVGSGDYVNTRTVQRHTIPLPFGENQSLVREPTLVSHTIELVDETWRETIAARGRTYDTTASAANNVTLAYDDVDEINTVMATVDLATVEIATDAELALDGDLYAQRFVREMVTVKIDNATFINYYKNRGDQSVTGLSCHYHSGGNYNVAGNENIPVKNIRVVTSGEDEYLEVAVPLYPGLFVGQQIYYVTLDLPTFNYAGFNSINFKVDCTFIEPTGITDVIQSHETVYPDISALVQAATGITGQAIYSNVILANPYSFVPISKFSGPHQYDSFPTDDLNGLADTVYIEPDTAGATHMRVEGGLHRQKTAYVLIVLTGVTLPAEWEMVQGAFTFIQKNEAVFIWTRFPELILPRDVYPFTTMTPELLVYDNGNAAFLRINVALDKTLLPTEIRNIYPGVQIRSKLTNPSNQNSWTTNFYLWFSSPSASQFIVSSVRSLFPATAADFKVETIGEITVRWSHVYAYEGRQNMT